MTNLPSTPEAALTQLGPMARPPADGAKRRATLLAAAAVTALLAAAGAGGYLLHPQGAAPETAAAAGVSRSTTPAPTSARPVRTTPAGPAGTRKLDFSGANTIDPRAAFTDPGLLALAEPYLTGPGADCVTQPPLAGAQEDVLCFLGNRRVGLFQRSRSAELLRAGRNLWMTDSVGAAQPGTLRSLRWKPADGRPGAKTDIPAGSDEIGAGVRVRWVAKDGSPRLYFDQDSATSYALLSSSGPGQDVDALGAYWASPSP